MSRPRTGRPAPSPTGRLAVAALAAILLAGVQTGSCRAQRAESGSSRKQREEAKAHERLPPPSAAEIAELPPDGGEEFNRLVFEKSPYLLQHCRNPVDWYPWGEEAFARAKKEDKAIFLSVGYSTCHWCHVMERESFEVAEVAEVMNRHFVCIKVDREERPDIDELYMNATQLFTGRGGWPNSLWLDSDGVPFFAGTYFPRGLFVSRLNSLADVWKNDRGTVKGQTKKFADALKQIAKGRGLGKPDKITLEQPLGPELVEHVARATMANFDQKHGGYGYKPKFPPHHTLALLLELHRRNGDAQAFLQVGATLDGIISGGIHDHVGGGFHRYSTDERWFLPHFEKMLYDNAFLGEVLVEIWRRTGHLRFREAAEGLYDWVLRVMTSPETGAFYSALDAESEGEEGKFYLWTPAQVKAVLGEADAALFMAVHQITEEGNYQEEATGRRTRDSVPHLTATLTHLADAQRLPRDMLRKQVHAARKKLREARAKRVWPGLDDKVLTDWNGLMIGSLARAGAALKRPDYLAAAKRAADFLLTRMRDEKGRLLHTFRDGLAKIPGFLSDHAYLAEGLLDLHEASGETRWLEEARKLTETMLERFWDPEGKGFYRTDEAHDSLLARSKDPLDKALPSGNGYAAQVLARLHRLTGEKRYAERARETLETAHFMMEKAPPGAQSLALALLMLDGEVPGASSGPGTATLRFKPLNLSAKLDPPHGKPGEAVKLDLGLTLDKHWHVNTDQPRQSYLIPTRLRAAPGSAVELGSISYPPPVDRKLPYSDTLFRLWEKTVTIQAKGKVAADAKPGPTHARLELTYQACDRTACLPPETRVLAVPFEVR